MELDRRAVAAVLDRSLDGRKREQLMSRDPRGEILTGAAKADLPPDSNTVTAAALDRFNGRCPASMGGVADFQAELRHDLSRQAVGLRPKTKTPFSWKCRRMG